MRTFRHLPILLVVVPLVGAVLTPIIGLWRRQLCVWWSSVVIFASMVMSAIATIVVYVTHRPISYHLGSWRPPFGIEILFDELSAWAFVTAALSLLVVIYSRRYIEKMIPEEKHVPYYTLILLIVSGMLGFVVTGDMFNLFVFLEIISLSAYALTAISGEKIAEMAAFKYLLVGAISSLAILLAIAFLYSITGTLNMGDLAVRLESAHKYVRVATIAFALFMVGFSVKAAVFPLHVWLPDAHAIAPSPISAILSGLVVKIGIFGILRVIYIFKFRGGLVNIRPVTEALCWVGAVAIVMGATFAIFQDDIKMLFAYSTISNIGYIILGIGLASASSLLGGIIHIFNHAIIKTTLFLCAGAIIYRTGYRKLSDLRGIGRKMPITMACLVIGAVSIVGIPPTAGFICKWYIASGAIEAGRPFFAVLLLLGALFIFAYYVKIINAAYFRKPKKPWGEVKEAPLSMLVPMVILAGCCLVFGVGAILPLALIKPAVARLLPEVAKKLLIL